MTAELKSSDEILEELFDLCGAAKRSLSEESSQFGENDTENEPKKHKKKKKKHRKTRKRHRSASADSEHSVEHKSCKHRKKKSHKLNDDEKLKKMRIKVKKEPDNEIPFNELDGIEENDNFMDTTTGKKLTIDDVFNSLGILTKSEIKMEGECAIKIKKEKYVEEESISMKDVTRIKVENESNEENDSNNDKNLNDVFEPKNNEEADENKSKKKKINIKDLKNSCIYEATIKEVEERERQKAEKYEEGELSTSSSSSENSDQSVSEEEFLSKSSREEYRLHRHRSKSYEGANINHSKTHRSKRNDSKHSHKTHKGRKSSVSPHRRSKVYHNYHHGYRRHRHRSRGSSVDSHDSSKPGKYRKSRSMNRDKSEDKSRSKTRSKMPSNERKSRSKSVEKIDKQKLLEIARRNAISLLKQGALPASVIVNKDKIASIKAGGKTVDELTDFCKQLSKKDAEGQESVSSGSDLDSNEDRAFHHPFQLKERPSSIVMNIRNAVSLPTKTAQEKTLQLSKQLSLQYPVSSGQQHRTTESEWVPVEKPTEPIISPQIVPPPAPKAPVTVPGSEPFFALNPIINPTVAYPCLNYNNGYAGSVVPVQHNVDIGSIVAQRLEAIRRLSENPQDPIGNSLIQVADSKMKVWAESKVQPGLFTGSTGVKPLSAAELSSGFKAWPKKNQFTTAKPVVSDKGEALMKKMGWQPGEGLGKYKQGPPEPCEISMKTDRKGLAEQTTSFQQNNPVKRAFELSQNKHPVSLLNEYCSRKKIGIPQYDCEEKEGAGRRKLFLFSVTVQGVKYTPNMPCNNKKQSKIEAATVCLQNLGLLPVIADAPN